MDRETDTETEPETPTYYSPMDNVPPPDDDQPPGYPRVKPTYARYARNLKRKQWQNCKARCMECRLDMVYTEWPSCNKGTDPHYHQSLHPKCMEDKFGDYVLGPIAVDSNPAATKMTTDEQLDKPESCPW